MGNMLKNIIQPHQKIVPKKYYHRVKLCKMGGGVYNLDLGYKPINSLRKT